jgi:hypothetical protein
MTIAALYRRALALLGDERGLAGVLAFASVAIGLIQLAEPVLLTAITGLLFLVPTAISMDWEGRTIVVSLPRRQR